MSYILGGRCINCGALGPHGPISKLFCGPCFNYLPKTIINGVEELVKRIQTLLETKDDTTEEHNV